MGAAPSKTFNPVQDLPSLKGKVVIVTGSRSGSLLCMLCSTLMGLSSSGIGFASLQHLLRLGAKVRAVQDDQHYCVLKCYDKVYMATPDEDRTKEALERVEKEGREPGFGEVVWHELDLKDPRTAKASAQKFMEKENRLDILSWLYLLHYNSSAHTVCSVNNAALYCLSSVIILHHS